MTSYLIKGQTHFIDDFILSPQFLGFRKIHQNFKITHLSSFNLKETNFLAVGKVKNSDERLQKVTFFITHSAEKKASSILKMHERDIAREKTVFAQIKLIHLNIYATLALIQRYDNKFEKLIQIISFFSKTTFSFA